MTDNLLAKRRWYANELRLSATLRNERLIDAFTTVPREEFVGPGPWKVFGANQIADGHTKINKASPQDLYHNVLVVIDQRRNLNNGLPSFLASLIERLSLNEGDTVCHVGCGTGYYTAIMAELVGPSGRIVAVEMDEYLSQCAKSNLRSYQQVDVVNADGFAYDPGRVNAIFVNAGVSHLSPVWLKALRSKGRMIVPLTLENGSGRVLRVVRSGANWQARIISRVGIFPCIGGRNKREERRLEKALKNDGAMNVRSLRFEKHRPTRECWLHAEKYCLSKTKWQTTNR